MSDESMLEIYEALTSGDPEIEAIRSGVFGAQGQYLLDLQALRNRPDALVAMATRRLEYKALEDAAIARVLALHRGRRAK